MYTVYSIYCKVNDKIYIGSTQHYTQRVNHHRFQLNNRTHANTYLLRDWISYGEESFEFTILETRDDKDQYLVEQSYINQYDREMLYNEQDAYSVHRPKKHNNRYAGILCVETGEVYESVPVAAKALGLNQSHIHECAKGNRKRCGGYHWEYAPSLDDSGK